MSQTILPQIQTKIESDNSSGDINWLFMPVIDFTKSTAVVLYTFAPSTFAPCTLALFTFSTNTCFIHTHYPTTNFVTIFLFNYIHYLHSFSLAQLSTCVSFRSSLLSHSLPSPARNSHTTSHKLTLQETWRNTIVCMYISIMIYLDRHFE